MSVKYEEINMLRRVKKLFKSDSGIKKYNSVDNPENSDNTIGSGYSETDIIVFESLIEKAVEKYDLENKNGGGPMEPDPNITEIENSIPRMMSLTYLQSSKPNLQSVLRNIANIISECGIETIDPINRAWDIFSYVLFRSNIMRPLDVLRSTSEYSGHADLTKDVLIKCTAESLAYIYITNPKIGAANLGLIISNKQVREISKKNSDIENRWINDRNYGLVPDKPVFAKGFGPHREYLDKLCTPDGQKLTYERRGSMEVKGIEGPVDIYDLFYTNGNKYMTIYQCVYGTHNSNVAPRGLMLK